MYTGIFSHPLMIIHTWLVDVSLFKKAIRMIPENNVSLFKKAIGQITRKFTSSKLYVATVLHSTAYG